MPDLAALVTDRPLCFVDLETTTANPSDARIVEIAVQVHSPAGGSPELRVRRLNPGVPIPAEATEVHGIHDEDVADCPPFKAVARDLFRMLRDVDLAGFNIRRFDLPILLAEWKRAGIGGFDPKTTWRGEPRRIIDLMQIFHLEEPRDLTAAARIYADVDLAEDAHSAEADTAVLPAILSGMLERYRHLPQDLDGLNARCDEYAPFQTEVERWFGDAEKPVFQFGKHEGKTLDHVWENESDYIGWMIGKSDADESVKDFVRGWRRRGAAEPVPGGLGL